MCSTGFVRLLKNAEPEDVFVSYCLVSDKNYNNSTLFVHGTDRTVSKEVISAILHLKR